jgi:hypothetical protein
MGELAELIYRKFPPPIVNTRVRRGYLRYVDRKKPLAIKHAWERFRQDNPSTAVSRDQPDKDTA